MIKKVTPMIELLKTENRFFNTKIIFLILVSCFSASNCVEPRDEHTPDNYITYEKWINELFQKRCKICKCEEKFNYGQGIRQMQQHDLSLHINCLAKIISNSPKFQNCDKSYRAIYNIQLAYFKDIFREFIWIIDRLGLKNDGELNKSIFQLLSDLKRFVDPNDLYRPYIFQKIVDIFDEHCNKILIKLAIDGNIQAIEFLKENPKIKLSTKSQRQILEKLENQSIIL